MYEVNEHTVECKSCGDKLTYRELMEEEGPCPFCGEDFACYVNPYGDVVCAQFLDDEHYWAVDTEDQDKVLCGYCREVFESHGNSLVVADPKPDYPSGSVEGDHYHRFAFDDGIVFDYDGTFPSLTEEMQQVVEEIVRGTYWQRTDGWRGSSRTPSHADGWVEAMGGWHSSMESSDLSEAINDIGRNAAGLDYPVILVFRRTSNLFSIGLSIYVREENIMDIKQYLENREARPGYAGLS